MSAAPARPIEQPWGDTEEPPVLLEPDACRFVGLRDDGEVSIAMVGIAATHLSGDPTLLFLHATRGVLYQGVQPSFSDYTPAIGFMSMTREGFALLNDGSVLDATGAQHQTPESGFAPAVPNIDEDGYLLVERAGELAYWDVTGDRLDRGPTAGVGAVLVAPVAIEGIEGREVAFGAHLWKGSAPYLAATVGTHPRISGPERCERHYERTGVTLIDHERGLEHFIGGRTTAAWLENADPTP